MSKCNGCIYWRRFCGNGTKALNACHYINKGYAKPFADKANEAIKNLSNGRNASAHGNTGNAPVSVADELVKLKGLLDAGVLTQEEFDAQKAKLLR